MSSGSVQILVVSRSDKATVSFLEGISKSVFYKKTMPSMRVLFVTHSKEEPDDDTDTKIDDLCKTINVQRINVDCSNEEETRNAFKDVVSNCIGDVEPGKKKKKSKKCTIL